MYLGLAINRTRLLRVDIISLLALVVINKASRVASKVFSNINKESSYYSKLP